MLMKDVGGETCDGDDDDDDDHGNNGGENDKGGDEGKRCWIAD
jgi:hypothetical protein